MMEVTNLLIDNRIDALCEALFAPLILFSASAAHLLPDRLRGHIKAERLMAVHHGHWDEATDTEALAYLYSTSLDRPLDYDITQIYGWLFTRLLRQEGREVPAELVVETLSRNQEEFFHTLKRWLRRQQQKAWSQQRREARQRESPALQPPADEVPGAFANEQLTLIFDSGG